MLENLEIQDSRDNDVNYKELEQGIQGIEKEETSIYWGLGSNLQQYKLQKDYYFTFLSCSLLALFA